MRALLLALFAINSVQIAETPNAPVVIESVSVVPNDSEVPVVTIDARSASDLEVPSWIVRIKVTNAEGKSRGVYRRSLGSVGHELQTFEVPLTSWTLEDSDRVEVSVVVLRQKRESAGTDAADLACDQTFCLFARMDCYMGPYAQCKSGCVKSFTCRIGRSFCESDCQCKTAPPCDH